MIHSPSTHALFINTKEDGESMLALAINGLIVAHVSTLPTERVHHGGSRAEHVHGEIVCKTGHSVRVVRG